MLLILRQRLLVAEDLINHGRSATCAALDRAGEALILLDGANDVAGQVLVAAAH